MGTGELFVAMARVVTVLVALGLLACGVTAAARRGRWRLPAMRWQGPLQMLGRQSLGHHHSICLVKVAQRVLVVGLSPQGIQLLKDLPDTALREGAPTHDLAGVP